MDAAVGCLYQPFTLALAGGCLPQHIFLRYTHQRLAVFRTGQRLLAKALSICKESEEEGQRVLGQALYGIEKDIAMLIEFQKVSNHTHPSVALIANTPLLAWMILRSGQWQIPATAG